jgi:hypothetical protein
MKRRERYIASLDEVTITRDGDYAWIAYKEEGIGATRLQIGPEIAEMSDREILELHNECLRAQAKASGRTSAWPSKCPWALRKSSTLIDVINGFQEVVCCAAWSMTMKSTS